MSNTKLAWWLTSPRASEKDKRKSILQDKLLYERLLVGGFYYHEVFMLCGIGSARGGAQKISSLIRGGLIKWDGTYHPEITDSKHYRLIATDASVLQLLRELLDRGTP